MKPPKPKPIHRAAKIAQDGSVSPLCAKRPQRIDLAKASWTLSDKRTTCPRCLKAIRGAEGAARLAKHLGIPEPFA